MVLLKRISLLSVAAMLAVSLSACKKKEEGPGPAERLGKQIDQGVEKMGQEINKAGEKIGQEMEKAGEKIKDATAKK
jgi:ABC-type branched-subunit amino acid transport system substrate-binding protein